MLGGALGAYVLSSVPGETIAPLVSAYLLVMGALILWKALRQAPTSGEPPKHLSLLGLAGGFLDAVGGGGWGPLVASTLVGQGATPRYAIGSTNLAEFFVTLTVSATFVATVGLELWPTIAGLILGGVLAAPFAAYVTQKLPDRPLMILVGVVIVLLVCGACSRVRFPTRSVKTVGCVLNITHVEATLCHPGSVPLDRRLAVKRFLALALITSFLVLVCGSARRHGPRPLVPAATLPPAMAAVATVEATGNALSLASGGFERK